jgi:hypothetical protein
MTVIRTIEFTVDKQSVTPAVRQFAGVAGEHNATKVIFTVENDLFENIKEIAGNEKELYYRFDCFDASGALYSTVPERITDLLSPFSASILLGENITRLGGEARIVLVVTLRNSNETEMELLSVPASVCFKGVPFASGKLEEAWGTGTAAVVSPIGQLFYQGKEYVVCDNKIGELTQKLYDNLTGIQWGKIEDANGWTVKVCNG